MSQVRRVVCHYFEKNDFEKNWYFEKFKISFYEVSENSLFDHFWPIQKSEEKLPIVRCEFC